MPLLSEYLGALSQSSISDVLYPLNRPPRASGDVPSVGKLDGVSTLYHDAMWGRRWRVRESIRWSHRSEQIYILESPSRDRRKLL